MTTLTKLLSSFVRQMKPDRAKFESAEVIDLPQPQRTGGPPLLDALAARRSEREFSTESLPADVLSNLLWAAFGMNRVATGGRTAPSALNAQEVDIYAAFGGGLYIYDAKAHALRLIEAADARRVTGYQDFVDSAPLDLVYVADFAHLKAVPAAQRAVFAGVAAGAISQNVYLFCATTGLATVARGWFDESALAKALHLGADQHIVLTQTVGYPLSSQPAAT